MDGREYDPIEVDARRGEYALLIACLLIAVVCGGLLLFSMLYRNPDQQQPEPTPQPTTSTTYEGIRV